MRGANGVKKAREGVAVLKTNTRRDFMKATAALGASAILPASILAQGRPATGRIDVHHHMMPPFAPGNNRPWTPELSLEAMDKNNVATAILSGVTFPEQVNDGTEKSRTLARQVNEYAAKTAQAHPGRFGFFASLPLIDTEGSLREITYAFDTLKADGIAINSSAGKKWPGDPSQMPVWEELGRRKATVFIHPNTTPFCCTTLPPGVGASMSEFDNDVNRAVLSLLMNGVMTKFPDINFIISHSGGTTAALAGHIQDRVPKDRADLYPYGALDKMRRLYFEIGHASFPWVIAGLMKFAPTTQLLFGTDYPVEPYESTTRNIPDLGLSTDVLYAMDRGNAERLFPKFRG